MLGKIAAIRENALSPTLPHGGRGRVAADSDVAVRLKKNVRNINSRDFQVAFIARQMEQTPQSFSDDL
ncbi:hypothetical protein [Neisseria cinerea]|uniref:hypothetical protein n=1 Tax=Neisseria cinerea TaxID=483 RepID=UPI0028D4C408|nr:hypothetical protein [Neisseria cinerea]